MAMNGSKSKSNSKSKSKSKSTSKSMKTSSAKSKSQSKSSTKSGSIRLRHEPLTENGFIMRLHREEGELDESYRQRIDFVRKIVGEKKVKLSEEMVPFVSTMSFVHVYKKSGMYGYPKEVEIAYQKLL